jgi:hypothetical protein
VHGAWNFLAVTVGLSAIPDSAGLTPSLPQFNAAPWIMVALAVGLLVLLLVMNANLKKTYRLSSLPPQLPPSLPQDTLAS